MIQRCAEIMKQKDLNKVIEFPQGIRGVPKLDFLLLN
jgi:hypothetical protein